VTWALLEDELDEEQVVVAPSLPSAILKATENCTEVPAAVDMSVVHPDGGVNGRVSRVEKKRSRRSPA
jgi:hypothetical protein